MIRVPGLWLFVVLCALIFQACGGGSSSPRPLRLQSIRHCKPFLRIAAIKAGDLKTDVESTEPHSHIKVSASSRRSVTSFNSRLFEPPPLTTQFERMVEFLKLKPHECLHSRALRAWARRNRNDRYVPSDLLKEWGLD